MGFTRYWTRPRELELARFTRFAERAVGITTEYREWLASVSVDSNRVYFEGKPGIEPLVIQRISHGREREGLVTEFCKTQLLPYDVAVERCLQALAAEFPEVELPPPS